ncbi:hypothetical protein KIPB_014628, partial [Kipferlia bialata]|eukprot:g14628.t1
MYLWHSGQWEYIYIGSISFPTPIIQSHPGVILPPSGNSTFPPFNTTEPEEPVSNS